MYNVILLFAFYIIFHHHHHGLGSWSAVATNVKRGFVLSRAPDVFVFLIFKAVSGGAVFRIFVPVFCIPGRGFRLCVGITPRTAVLSSLYLFFVILYPPAALPYSFTQSFFYILC